MFIINKQHKLMCMMNSGDDHFFEKYQPDMMSWQLSSDEPNVNALENVISTKQIGVIVDRHLTWKPHIDKLAKIIIRKITPQKQIINISPHETNNFQ